MSKRQPRFNLGKEYTKKSDVVKIILKYIKKTYSDFKFIEWVEVPKKYTAMREDNCVNANNYFGAIAKIQNKSSNKIMFVRAGLHGVFLGLSKPRQTITSHVEADAI